MENFKTPRIKDYNGDLSKRWYIQYAYLDPDTKKFIEFRIWISSSSKTKTSRYFEAKKIKDELNSKLIQGFNPLIKKELQTTIKKAIEIVVNVKASTLRKRTWHTYNSIGNLFCNWLVSNKYSHLMPNQLTKHIVQQYFDYCIINEKISHRTFNNRLRSLRTLFNDLMKRDYIEYNVFTKFKLLKETEPLIKAFTDHEKKLIKETIENTKRELWLAAMFVYYGFVRPQELVRLKIGDINFINKTLTISGEKSKNKRTNIIIIPNQLHELLLKMNYNKISSDLYIFSNGRKLTPGTKEISPNRIFNEWKENVINVTNINKGIYLFKHTGAGELFENRADPRNIQLQLRHSSLEETISYLDKYSNTPNESLREYFQSV